MSAERHQQKERAGCEPDPAEHDGERRQLDKRHLGEEERAAPQQRERDQQELFHAAHRRPGGHRATLFARSRSEPERKVPPAPPVSCRSQYGSRLKRL
jgi:hypothetical protein